MSEVVIEIDGIEMDGFEATGIHRNLDTVADGFSFSGSYDPDAFNAHLLEPPQKIVNLKIDGELYISAISEKWDPGFEMNSSITAIECRSRAGVLTECTSTVKTSTYKNQTLQDIANSELAPFGIKAIFPDGNSPSIKIAQRCPTETIFSFLKKLSCGFEFIMTSTKDGYVSFIKPGINVESAGELHQGMGTLISVDTSYDYSKRYSEYTASGQFPGNPSAISTVHDESIEIFRPIMFQADAKNETDLKMAAEWRMTRALVSAEISIKVSGWRDQYEKLWVENKTLTFSAPGVYLHRPYDYLIKNVQLDKTDSDGEIANLTLVMPESFTGEFPRYLPWMR